MFFQTAAAQMAAAVSGEVSWGMGDDAAMDPEDLSTIDWRVYMSSGNTLNEKQQKLAERVRAREHKMANLRTEIDRIQVIYDDSPFVSILTVALFSHPSSSLHTCHTRPSGQGEE